MVFIVYPWLTAYGLPLTAVPIIKLSPNCLTLPNIRSYWGLANESICVFVVIFAAINGAGAYSCR